MGREVWEEINFQFSILNFQSNPNFQFSIVVINFNKKFYNLKSIQKAIKAFHGLADFKISQNKKTITVNLENINPEAKSAIKDEFCNYVLGLMKQ